VFYLVEMFLDGGCFWCFLFLGKSGNGLVIWCRVLDCSGGLVGVLGGFDGGSFCVGCGIEC